MLYSIAHGSGFTSSLSDLVLQATSCNWHLEISGASDAIITQDSRFAIFMKENDSLGIIQLGSSTVEYIPEVSSYKIPKNGGGELLVYQISSPVKKVVLRNLITKKEKGFADVNDYFLADDGKTVVLHTNYHRDNIATEFLQLVTLSDDSLNTIWSRSGQGIGSVNLVFDNSNTKLAFIVENKMNNFVESSLWYYNIGTRKTVLLTDNKSLCTKADVELGGISRFSFDGSGIFLLLKEKEQAKPKFDAVEVKVWAYNDAKLQSEQMHDLAPRYFNAFFNIEDMEIVRLERNNQHINLPPYFENYKTDEFAILSELKGNPFEWQWNSNSRQSTYLISTRTGALLQINRNENSGVPIDYKLSPGGKFVIYYNPIAKNFFTYEISSGKTRDITHGISTKWSIDDDDEVNASNGYYPPAGWLEGDSTVLIYDQYDIWQVDPKNQRLPVEITNGYGRKHKIELRLASTSDKVIPRLDNTLLIIAYNRSTKDNGFYKITLRKRADPEILTMGAYIYYMPNIGIDVHGMNPIKARNTEKYIVERMSAEESPNYFFTSDFKTYTPLSNIHPENKYKWYTTELHSWKKSDGIMIQGLLFKPENFNPQRTYPVILQYYEILSDGLNAFLQPKGSDGDLDIPWFVSHDYLVFEPDIHFKIGLPGQSALESVLSAANYLSKMPFVDRTKMGIQGFSFGGLITNYIITHSKLFAAACSAAGVSDFVSFYGALTNSGSSNQTRFEIGQVRIGANLWKKRELYIDNSAIFSADKVKTPLLMMHTTHDGAVPFAQAIEFFTALRRLGKKAWLLQYDDCDHGLWGKSADDFSIRTAQFFGHFLKGEPMPNWMEKDIFAKNMKTGD